MQKARGEQLDDAVQMAAAQVHAAMARLTTVAAEFEAEDVWHEWGFSSCPHWLSVSGGFDLHTGREILRVGQALRSLPALRAAFAGGELSLDKLRAITRVASPADEQVWLEIAQVSSGAQLIRICREFHKVLDPEAADQLEAARGVEFSQRLDGLVTITARLLPEEAEIVSAAIEKVQREQEAPEGRPWAQRDADGFVSVFKRELAADPHADDTAVARLVIHVEEDKGVAHGRFRISAEAARELGCGEAEVQYQTERDGVPIDLGRARRLASPQLARAVRARDGGCVFPGCGRKKVHLHHLEHWMHGGPTNLRNLVGLCAFHHHQLHRGAFLIHGKPGHLRIETGAGSPIGSPARAACERPPDAPGNPAAVNYTPRLDFRRSVGLIADSLHFANRDVSGSRPP